MVLTILKIIDNKIIIATIMVIVIILLTMEKDNHTNDIKSDNFS